MVDKRSDHRMTCQWCNMFSSFLKLLEGAIFRERQNRQCSKHCSSWFPDLSFEHFDVISTVDKKIVVDLLNGATASI